MDTESGLVGSVLLLSPGLGSVLLLSPGLPAVEKRSTPLGSIVEMTWMSVHLVTDHVQHALDAHPPTTGPQPECNKRVSDRSHNRIATQPHADTGWYTLII